MEVEGTGSEVEGTGSEVEGTGSDVERVVMAGTANWGVGGLFLPTRVWSSLLTGFDAFPTFVVRAARFSGARRAFFFVIPGREGTGGGGVAVSERERACGGGIAGAGVDVPTFASFSIAGGSMWYVLVASLSFDAEGPLLREPDPFRCSTPRRFVHFFCFFFCTPPGV